MGLLVDERIDPRIARRRQDVVRDLGRRKVRRLVILASIATLAVVAYALSRSRVADVDRVVVIGSSRTSSDAILAASGIKAGDQLLGVDPVLASQAIGALPWIKQVSVERLWRDGDVRITVQERQPAVQIADTTTGWLLVDDDRRVLARIAEPDATLVRLEGVEPAAPGQQAAPEMRAGIDVAAALTPGLRTRVASVVVGPGGIVTLKVLPSGTVRFGRAEELPAKIRSLQTVFARVDLAGLCGIDLRVPDTPVIDRRQPCA